MKWYTISEYYDAEGNQITKEEAIKNYEIIKTTKNVTRNRQTGYKKQYHYCRRKKYKQLEIFGTTKEERDT